MADPLARYAIERVDWSDPLSYVREMYGVPADVGRRIRYCGQDASIVGGDGGYLVAAIDGEDSAVLLHPTWRVEYLDLVPA